MHKQSAGLQFTLAQACHLLHSKEVAMQGSWSVWCILLCKRSMVSMGRESREVHAGPIGVVTSRPPRSTLQVLSYGPLRALMPIWDLRDGVCGWLCCCCAAEFSEGMCSRMCLLEERA
eukprot:4970487-Amphidinium_carterae.1